MTPKTNELLARATSIMAQAYAPYSNFSVGAAVLTSSGNIYVGCNVENVSFGLTICAERNAIAQAVAAEGPSIKLEEIVVTNKNADGKSIPCSPCGACRQVIAEFSHPQTAIQYRGKQTDIRVSMEQLLPDSFRF
ncbi:cytidine deaminase [Sneathiella aquimaris]|uniref:cytidine deaminase n=1 Tax=Sneathiella aquimaris TaxID=2599305 RepID=UPI00146D2A66|nr:cytidine deaminase [Sneathiella aquimaris]